MEKSVLSEEELIVLLQAKDKKAFDTLYDTYGKALYCIIARIVQDGETAQEVLEDSFIHIWKQAPSYDSSKGSLLSWLLNITRKTATDRKGSRAYRVKDHTRITLTAYQSNEKLSSVFQESGYLTIDRL